MQDAFTDMSISVRKMNVDEEPYCSMKTYVHMGMHATAVTIHNMLFENEVLQLAFDKFPVSSVRFHWKYHSYPVLTTVMPCSMCVSHSSAHFKIALEHSRRLLLL